MFSSMPLFFSPDIQPLSRYHHAPRHSIIQALMNGALAVNHISVRAFFLITIWCAGINPAFSHEREHHDHDLGREEWPDAPCAVREGNLAYISQTGQTNRASLEQHGSNQADIIQEGSGNQIRTEQTGKENVLLARQYGNENRILVSQSGISNQATILQFGNELTVRLWQQGDMQLARIIQTD